MRFILTVGLIFAAFVSVDFAQKTRRKSPPKRIELIQDLSAAPSSKNGVTIERYVSNYDVNADGTATRTLELQQRLETAATLARYGKIEQTFNAALQTAEVLDAYILKGNKQRIAVPRADIAIRPTPQAEAAPAFSSLKAATIEFKNAKVGDSVGYKIRVVDFKPMFVGHFDATEILQSYFDWNSAEINVSAPADYRLFVQAIDLEGGKLPDAGDGRARWQWRRRDFVAPLAEIGSGGYVDNAPRLSISSFENYEELGALHHREAAVKSAVTPEVQKLADDITKNIAEPAAQAAAIYEWTNKNIRYLSIVLGRDGWIPHDANSIIRNGYGDCKDYTTLIRALLAAKKIESHPVVVRAEAGLWTPEVASPEFFDHMILYIPSLDLFADATAPNTRLGLISQVLNGKKVFLAGERTGKIQIPFGKPEDTQFLSDTELTFDAAGNVRSVSKNNYVGRSEMLFRPLFADERLMENSEMFVKMILSTNGINGTGKILKVSDSHRVGEPFGIEIEARVNDFMTFLPKGTISIPVGLNLQNFASLGVLARAETRTANLHIGAMIFEEKFRLRFPAKVTIENPPPALKIDNSAVSYSSEAKVENNELVVHRKIIFKKDVVAPNEYKSLRDAIGKIVYDAGAHFSYRADASFMRAKSAAMRKNPVRKKSAALEDILGDSFDFKPLTAREVTALEASLTKTPDDLETRRKLLRHYSVSRGVGAVINARLRHRLWFAQNRAEIADDDIMPFDFFSDDIDSTEYKTLKPVWLAQTEKSDNAAVFRNAIDFFESVEWEIAAKIADQAAAKFPTDYRFALKLFEIYAENWTDWNEYKPFPASEAVTIDASAEKLPMRVSLEKARAAGAAALDKLKTERSETRDTERAQLLPRLSKMAFDDGDLEKSKSLALELILEFGDAEDAYRFSQAAHTGNIILGRIALRQNDPKRAAEHLLIAARAPLRTAKTYLKPDIKLARELFEKGEKTAVLEYLQLCEKFNPDYLNLKTIKRWQTEIKTGKTPNFNQSEL